MNIAATDPSKGKRREPPAGLQPGFSPAGMLAFSVGTSIGWGSFIVTCNTYLQKSGLLGTVFGLLAGMAVILVIAYGMARYEDEACVAEVFDRADHNMYENKSSLKAGKTRSGK
jgi:hypothetical protein